MRKLFCAIALCGLVSAAMVLTTTRRAQAFPPPTSGGLFFAILTGDQEVPPVDTDAIGIAAFKEVAGGNALFFTLLTFGLEDIAQAHIHLAPEGVNGPVVAFLFESVADPVTQDGLLSFGVIRADDLVGPLAGQPLSALIEQMADGNTYSNVHTLAHPSGEIRGQNGGGFVLPAPDVVPAAD